MQGEEMVFDNSVVTDGVSISFQMIDRSNFGRKSKFEKKNPEDKEKTKEKKVQDKKSIRKTAKFLGCDPGKRDILAITDGVTTIRYTKGQRQHDCLQFVQRRETLAKRKKNNIDIFESQELSKHCKKTCSYSVFKSYCATRMSKEAVSKQLYRKAYFREFKFTKYCKMKGSERRMINKVKDTFKTSNPRIQTATLKALPPPMVENALKETEDLVIGWGNWGKNPNALKGCCPTPGIGIRRRFESFFDTVTVCEHLTSQTCPCCQTEKSLKKMKRENTNYEIHHLLRCTNDNCQSRLWNRNVAGSLNILKRFIERPSGEEATGTGT